MRFLFRGGVFVFVFFISEYGYGQNDRIFIHESRIYGSKLKLVLKKDSTYHYDANVFWSPEKNRQDSGIWNSQNSVIILNSFQNNPSALFINTELIISKGKKRALNNLHLREQGRKSLFKKRIYLYFKEPFYYYK
ncbi:MAG: hypothetical protein M3Q58_11265 [Bacteroidota bacterium]|nr:hypothetical protein [Bacteroidota bacterium]